MKGFEDLGPDDMIVVCKLSTDFTPFNHFPDNIAGRCHFCSREIRYRPHNAVAGAKYVCEPCAYERLQPGDTLEITKDTLQEMALFQADPDRIH